MIKCKVRILLVIVICSLAILSGCGIKEFSPWVIANGSPEDTVTYYYTVKFAEEVERLSNGKIEVQTYVNSTLGGDTELLENCVSGDIPFVVQNTAPQVSYIPEIAVFDLPCVFSDIESVRDTIDDKTFISIINEIYNSKGIRLLGMADQGFRVMSTNVNVQSFANFKGIKIRTMENEYHIAFWQALKANPTPINFGEVYIGLQQGALDAQENPYEVIVSSKFYEQQDYLVETNHLPHLISLITSTEFYEGLTAGEQAIVDEAAANATEYARQLSDKRITERIQTIVEDDTGIVKVSDELLAKMREACRPLYEKIHSVIGDKLYDAYMN